MKHALSLLLLVCSLPIVAGWQAANLPLPEQQNPQTHETWVQETFEAMSLEERIGQLFMVAAYSNRNDAHIQQIESLVRNHHIGGLIFFQGGPVRQAYMCNRLQDAAKTPLLVGMDAEWGLSMRLDSTPSFPRQMTLGALPNDALIYEMGREIARQFKRMGMHINFAPVADVNNNPVNPVINSRSFGELRENVALKSAAYMQGMQDERILANAKHFPGHGDTDTDSHHALPIIRHSRERLDSLELYPFRELIDRGLASMMVAHMFVPALDDTEKQASTLSRKIVHDLLREEMGFQGLIITDALNMKGVSAQFSPGTAELKALLAGNDVLLFAEDVPKAVKLIKEALEKGDVTEEEINTHCLRILRAKAWVGLHEYRAIEVKNLVEDLNHPRAASLTRRLVRGALTPVVNQNDFLPLATDGSEKVLVVSFGGKDHTPYRVALEQYGWEDYVELPTAPDRVSVDRLLSRAAGYDKLIVNVMGTSQNTKKNFGLTSEAMACINLLNKDNRVGVVHFGNPYALLQLRSAEKLDALVVAYQDNSETRQVVAEALAGRSPLQGSLPVGLGDFAPAGSRAGVKIQGLPRGLPEEWGVDAAVLAQIDSIALRGIREMAYPGCQVLVARHGHVVYERSFGYHTYDNTNPVTNDDLYDLASLTKVLSSTAALMHLQDAGLFDLDRTLGDYLSWIPADSPYRKLVLRKVMSHTAGLIPWIPFYQKTLEKGVLRADIYSEVQNEEFPVRVAEGVFMKQQHSDTLIHRILGTRLRNQQEMRQSEYAYSDLGYFFVKEIVEQLSGMPLQDYVATHFYGPMKLNTIGYLPLQRFSTDVITPTEYDRAFRKRLVHGDVHDPGAAMQGGVGGHAGLFSNAHDVAAMMQLFVNKGVYNGVRYLSEEVLEEYTRCQYCLDEKDKLRRGAGFDKPVMDKGPGPTCDCVTFETYGHTGFTGTMAWADPEKQLVYVFLSNRVYPTAENKKLTKLNIRTNIQQVIYDALVD